MRGGLCHGTTIRFIEAFLLNQQHQFIERLNQLPSNPQKADTLVESIHDTQKYFRSAGSLTGKVPETKEQLEHLDMLAFLDSLILYHLPHQQTALLGQETKQKNIDEISLLAGSEAIRQQGGLSIILTNTNMYALEDIKNYLKRLQAGFQEELSGNDRLGMVLSAKKHAIGLCFNAQNNSWTLMDINQWPPVTTTSIDEMAEEIFNAFRLISPRLKSNHSNLLAMNTQIIGINPKKIKTKLFKSKLNKKSDNQNNYPIVNETSDLAVLAAQNGNTAVITKLLKQKNIDLNTPSEYGLLPLVQAAANGQVNIVKMLLLESSINPNASEKEGISALYMAAQNGHQEVVTQLLKQRKIDPDIAKDNGYTPLLIAAQKGHLDVVKLLLKHKAAPNQADITGTPPLYVAAHKEHLDIVELLIENGSNPNLACHVGQTPLLIAAQKGHLDVVKLLLKHKAAPNQADNTGIIPLYRAAQHGHLEIVEQLLKAGATPNLASKDGQTPLLMAVYDNHHETAKLLMAHGADAHKATLSGATSLAIAIERKQLDMIDLMLKMPGANISKQELNLLKNISYTTQETKSNGDILIKNDIDTSGASALTEALINQHFNIVELLLAQGVEPNKEDIHSRLPFVIACYYANEELIKKFIAKGANANLFDKDGLSALNISVIHNLLNIVHILHKEGVNLNLPNSSGATPLSMAAYVGHLKIVEFLLEKGAKPNQKDKDGQTPIDYANKNGHTEVVKLLMKKEAQNRLFNLSARLKIMIEHLTIVQKTHIDGKGHIHNRQTLGTFIDQMKEHEQSITDIFSQLNTNNNASSQI